MRTIIRFWRSQTATTVDGELARRREAVLLELLATLVVVGVIAQVVQWTSPLFQAPNPDFWINWSVVLATTLAFYGLLRAARRGRHRRAAWTLCWLLTAIGGWLLVRSGLLYPVWPYLFAAALLLAGLLLGRRESIAVLTVQLLALVALWWLQAHELGIPANPDPPSTTLSTGNVIAPALLSVVVVRACWLYTRDVITIDELVSHDADRSPLTQLRTKRLTVREIEVVQLVAEGLSNDQIAERLFLSTRTVQNHVANARGKTGTANRTALGVLAVREGLAPLAPDAEPVDAA